MGGEQDMRKMGGLKGKIKITFATMMIGTIAIAGIPPFSGFFSKDEILAAAYAHNPIYYAIGVITAMLTSFYMFRMMYLTFWGTFRGTHEQEHHLHESPPAMTIPLVILAILSIVGGFMGIPVVFAEGADRLTGFLSPVIKEHKAHTISHSTEYLLMGLSTVLMIGMIIFAWLFF